MRAGYALVLLAALGPCVALGEQDEASEIPRLLPRARASISTKGEATLQVAADLYWSFSQSAFDLAPVFEATASSHKAVFSTDEATMSSSFPIRVGLEGTYYWNPPPDAPSPQDDAIDLEATRTCKKVCRCRVVRTDGKASLSCGHGSPDCKAFEVAANDVNAATYPAIIITENLCREGEDQRDKHYGQIATAFPVALASLGFTTGVDSFSYLEPQGSGTLILVDGHKYGSAKVAGYLVFMPSIPRSALQLSFELFGSSEWKHQSSSTEARWCTPAGSVPREGGGSDPAEVCQTRPLGVPVSVTQVDGLAAVGMAEATNARWRLALGGSLKGLGDDWALGLTVPVYIRIAGDEAAGQFKGILALALTARWRLTSGTNLPDQEVFLTIALLGRRSLFGTALEQ